MSTSSPPPDRAPTVPAALLAEVQRDLGALARSRRRRAAGFAAAALGVVFGFAFASSGHHPVHGFTAPGCGSPLHTALLVGFALAGLGLVGLAFGLTVPTGRALRPVPLAGLVLALAGLATIAALWGHPVGAASHGARCLATGAVLSLALVALALAFGRPIIRRHAPSAALFGVGVGLLALVPLSLACHDASMPHLMIWHGLIPIAGGLLGALAWRIARPNPA